MDEQLLKTVTVKVQPRSGFDKSFKNLLTTKVGTLTPLLCDEVVPNTKINLRVSLSACLPPLATDTFMRCNLKTEAFFVPSRLLNPGFVDWFMSNPIYDSSTESDVVPSLPVIVLDPSGVEASAADIRRSTGPGTLADYLGFRCTLDPSLGNAYLSALPFLAYHKIYDDWYRNTLIQRPVFRRSFDPSSETDAMKLYLRPLTEETRYLPYFDNDLGDGNLLGDGVGILNLRQRNFGADYFTTATPDPQKGNAQTVSFNTSGATGNFSIAALRAANSMQQFLERNNLPGNRLVDFVRAKYGADLSDGVAQRSILLGSSSFPVYSKGVYQTTDSDAVNQNPFSSTATKFGSASASGSDFIIKGFTAQEPGYIMVLVSLVPEVSYSSGISRYLTHYTGLGDRVDMADPLLQNIGNQPIFSREVIENLGEYSDGNDVFGYTERFAEFKTRQDEVHGLLRDGELLDSFALQRTVVTTPSLRQIRISDNFLEIPTDYLDQVSAVAGEIGQYGCWIDSYLDYKVAQPLARYAVPSLQDPAYEHGVSVTVQRGGAQLN